MAVGKRLKSLIEEHGRTVSWVAERTGIPKGTLYAIISRDATRINTEKAAKIFAALGVTAKDGFNYILDNPPPVEYDISPEERISYLTEKAKLLNDAGQSKATDYIQDLLDAGYKKHEEEE